MSIRSCAAPLVLGIVIGILPSFASAYYVDYGAYYTTPAPYYQTYYQPMYAYSYAPAQSSQNTYISYPQQNYSYGYYPQQYGYYAPQYSYPSYSYPGYSYAPYGNMYGQHVPYSYGYPTGDTVPLIGGQLCTFPDYPGRALCGSNPNQWVYDPWTGSWY